MKLRIRLLLTLASIVIAVAPVWSQSLCDTIPGNLVSNCGFETGDFTGWASTGGFPLVAVSDYAEWVHTGIYGAALGTEFPWESETLTQWVGGPYTSYYLTFYLENPSDLSSPPDSFLVFWNGVDVGPDIVDSGRFTWEMYSIDLTGFISSQQLNQLTFEFSNYYAFWGLDDISLTSTPEPGALTLLGTGGLGLAGALRRKIKL